MAKMLWTKKRSYDYPQTYYQSPEGTKDYRQAVESRKDGTPADVEPPERNSEGVTDSEGGWMPEESVAPSGLGQGLHPISRGSVRSAHSTACLWSHRPFGTLVVRLRVVIKGFYLFSSVFICFFQSDIQSLYTSAEGVILTSNSRQIRMIRFIRGGK